MLKNLVLLTLGLALMAQTGCGTTAKFTYPADAGNLARFRDAPNDGVKVAVTPFKEMRGNTNQSGTMALYLIPLMPFGWERFERPEAATGLLTIGQYDFDASEDLAKAAVYSLRESGLFKDVFFTFGGDKDEARYLFEGDILSTDYKGTMYTYGLSAYGPIVWLFGLPVGSSRDDLALSLSLVDQTTGQKVWTKQYHLDKKIIQGMYYGMGHDTRGYPYLMQEIMNDAVEDLREKL